MKTNLRTLTAQCRTHAAKAHHEAIAAHCEALQQTVALCSHCRTHPAKPAHVCPFKADIDGDYKTLCDCCEFCADDCAMEI